MSNKEHKSFIAYAFADNSEEGNPAGVVLLDQWPSIDHMQKIAADNNLPETAFILPRGSDHSEWDIRWFTPIKEVPLCGHATLASAAVLDQVFSYSPQSFKFYAQRDFLEVKLVDSRYRLDLPSDIPTKSTLSIKVIEALGLKDVSIFKGRDYYLLKLSDEIDIKNTQPNFNLLKKYTSNGIIISSKGDDVDFVSRFFAPSMGIDEDYVTGSAHCVLVPFWSKILRKKRMYARQVSSRGGNLECSLKGDRIQLIGNVYIESERVKNV
tara:strand:+ start:1223 stop:2023 length:801 start_codon:yes stop_codon:yes gene_type:complete